MAHVVMITSEMAGRVKISKELGRRLAAAGHRVTIASPADIGDGFDVNDPPFVHLASQSADDESGVLRSGSPAPPEPVRSRLPKVLLVWHRRNAAALALDLDSDGVANTLEVLGPDLILVDIELPVHVMAATSVGIPVALWMSMMSVWKRPGLPPLHTAITPGARIAGSKFGMEVAWLKFRSGKWLGVQRRRIRQLGADRISVLQAVAKRTGFHFEREAMMYEWLAPLTFRSLPVLSFNAFELEFPHDPQSNCTYVGPMLRSENRAAADRDKSSEPVAELLARRDRGETASLVYCTFGAWHKGDDTGFLQRVIDAVAGQPEWELVVGLGGRVESSAFSSVPANVHVLAWAPQQEILRVADIAIHHGGISTVNECIASATPMVVYPFDFLDQRGNAARVGFHRLGEVGDRETETVQAIRARIFRLLADDAVQANVRRMSNVFADYDRAGRAVSAVEDLL